MFIIAPQTDGSLLVHVIAPLSQITWDSCSAEYKDHNTKELLFIEPACRHERNWLGAPSTVEVGSFKCALNVTCFTVTLELPEQEMVELCEHCEEEDDTQAGCYINLKAIVPPNERRVLATVEYVWPDRQKTEATS
jgi:hypothetical protein